MSGIIGKFGAWVETKSEHQPFDYVDNLRCPYALFLRETRHIKARVSPTWWIGLWWFVIPCWGRVPEDINWILSNAWPRTFGMISREMKHIS